MGIAFLMQKGDILKSKAFENVFKDLKRGGAKACVISSMEGVPIAWFGTEKKSVDLYSTLSAAVMSASVILHKESNTHRPTEVISHSKDSAMIIRYIGDDHIFVVLSDRLSEELSNACDKAEKELRGVMK